jgi:polysaccharide biosynthesis transport protein
VTASPFWPAPRPARQVMSRALSVGARQPATQSRAVPADASLGDLFAAVRHRLPSIVLLTLLTTSLGVAYIAAAKPEYTASSAIFIDPRSRRIVNEDVQQGGFGVDTSLFESQVSIIGSDAILRRVVNAEKLTSDLDFVPPVRSGLLATISDKIRGPRTPLDPVDQAVEMLARKTKVKRAQNTYVVTVDVASGEPTKSARIANAILKAYQDDQTAAKSDAASRANAAIDGRLEELKAQVRTAELMVDDFRRQNRIVTSEGGMLNEQQLTKLNTELAAVRSQLATNKAKLDELQATLRRGVSPDSLPEAMASPVIQRLREQLASALRREAALSSQLQARHPVMADANAQVASVRSQIVGELRRITDQVQNEYTIAAGREREILRALGESQREVSDTTTSQIRLRELEREADASREVLRAFLSRAKETQEQKEVQVVEARVISPASVPPRPSSPNIPLILAFSAFSGLGLGMLRALLKGAPALAADDTRAASPSQRLALDGATPPLRALGTIPALGRRGALGALMGTNRPLGPADVLAALADAKNPTHQLYRTGVERTASRLRALAAPGQQQIVLMVSSEKGAGTSLSALALAYTRACAGERVLLIDAASADPALSLEFAGDLHQDEPCILDSKEHLAAIASREPESGLMFLPIALADLRTLTSGQRKRLSVGIASLASDYDLVVIDGGALDEDDTIATLSELATTVVVVARAGSGKTDIHVLADALNVAPNRIAGVVATMATARPAA